LPRYAQFDNDPVFHGPHIHPDTLGRVARLCLSPAVTPVFAPPSETGFQAAIESYNARWQAKAWNRFDGRADLRKQPGHSLFLSCQCPVNASAVFSCRLKIFFVWAYPVTFFTALLTVSAAVWTACLAFPTT
jgi:hypothetical protein